MEGFEYYQPLINSAKYVDEVLPILRSLTRSPETRELARSLTTELVNGDLPSLLGSPNEWFNLVTYASQIDYTTAERAIFEAAFHSYPHDVDLLCQWFQFHFAHGNIDDAAVIWQQIEALGEEETAPYWRYWVYRATFLANFLNDRTHAVEFLERAENQVVPEGLLNIFRHYRTVLIDGGVKPSASGGESTSDYDALAKTVEKKFREGLRLGIENGYVLASALARLLRERSAGKSENDVDRVLDEALALLDLAERTYTGNPNHPIEDIYVEKAVTFMARRRYADALQIFRSLPSYRLDQSMIVMARYAANMTGQKFESESPIPTAEIASLESRVSRIESVLAAILGEHDGAQELAGEKAGVDAYQA
jgi:hypothetical protein